MGMTDAITAQIGKRYFVCKTNSIGPRKEQLRVSDRYAHCFVSAYDRMTGVIQATKCPARLDRLFIGEHIAIVCRITDTVMTVRDSTLSICLTKSARYATQSTELLVAPRRSSRTFFFHGSCILPIFCFRRCAREGHFVRSIGATTGKLKEIRIPECASEDDDNSNNKKV